MILHWEKGFDGKENQIWEAVGPYEEEFMFRIVRDTEVWGYMLNHDDELMTDRDKLVNFATLQEAQDYCQSVCSEIINNEKLKSQLKEPLLGLATNEQLIDELRARIAVYGNLNYKTTDDSPFCFCNTPKLTG